MDNLEARKVIIDAALKHGGVMAISRAVGCHRSFLYQFAREGGPNLGPQLVSKLRTMVGFEHITPEVWLAAMGVVDLPAGSFEAPAVKRGRPFSKEKQA